MCLHIPTIERKKKDEMVVCCMAYISAAIEKDTNSDIQVSAKLQHLTFSQQ
jgi:hypothetical protein